MVATTDDGLTSGTSASDPTSGEDDTSGPGESSGEDDDDGVGSGGESSTTTTAETTGSTGAGIPDDCASAGAGGMKGEHAFVVQDYPASMIYVPDSYDESQPAPLVVSLHGAGDNAPNFNEWWKEAADAEGVVVLTAESAEGPGRGWNPAVDDDMLTASIEAMENAYNIDTCRRIIAGFSNGGHYAYMYGLAHADEFAGIGVHAGSLQFAASAGIFPDAVSRTIAVDIHHGTADPVIPFSHAEMSRDALEQQGHPVYFMPLEGVAHTIRRQYANEMWANLSGHSSLE